MLEFEAEDALLLPEFVELGIEVSQSSAASMELRAPVDEVTLGVVGDDHLTDVVLLLP